jgi:hypothetical protein
VWPAGTATRTDGAPPPRLVSSLPGRHRYLWPLLRDHPDACQLVAERLLRLPAVTEVRTFPLSGAVVVRFDAALEPEAEIERVLREESPPVVERACEEAAAQEGVPADNAREHAHEHPAHNIWGVLLLARMLGHHLLLDRSGPLRGKRLRHAATALGFAGLTPVLWGVVRDKEIRPHALEILLTIASLVMRENRWAVTFMWLLHIPEARRAFLLMRGRARHETPPAANEGADSCEPEIGEEEGS